jgi:16S rRNA processing protein RimM
VGGRGGRFVVVGRISGIFGVRGEVRVESFTEPREQLLELSPWYLERCEHWEEVAVLSGRTHGKGLVARLAGFAEREQVRAWIGRDVAVRREQLPATSPGQYYWADLLGLSVVNSQGDMLGRVSSLMETGANDVLVVQGAGERLIPFVPGRVVRAVDLEGGIIEVDWAAED